MSPELLIKLKEIAGSTGVVVHQAGLLDYAEVEGLSLLLQTYQDRDI